MKVKTSGRKRINQKAFDTISNAGKKEIVIMKKEWKLAQPPGAWLLRKYLNAEFRVNTLEDNSGWVIKLK